MLSPQKIEVHLRQLLDDVPRTLVFPHQARDGFLPRTPDVKVTRPAMEVETQMDLLVFLALLALAALTPAPYVRLDQGSTHEIAQPAQLLDQCIALLF